MNNHEIHTTSSTWRISIGNINTFPTENNGPNKYKLDRLRKLVIGNNSDIVIMSERNRNPRATSHNDHPAEIMKKWWPRTITRISSLVSNNTLGYEPGGTMIVTNTRSTVHTCQTGEDTQHLGRWNYITFRGKNEFYTTVISIYRPNKYQETYMRQTIHSAKRRKALIEDTIPEDLWFLDLGALITEKKEEGHEIIVAGDFNDDLNNNESKTNRFMDKLGLKEALISLNGNGPPTHIRGSTTIDGVFATPGIQVCQGKYTTFEQSPSDHRWIVLDILESSIIGTSRPHRF
jgi:hypothetical protein